MAGVKIISNVCSEMNTGRMKAFQEPATRVLELFMIFLILTGCYDQGNFDCKPEERKADRDMMVWKKFKKFLICVGNAKHLKKYLKMKQSKKVKNEKLKIL